MHDSVCIIIIILFDLPSIIYVVLALLGYTLYRLRPLYTSHSPGFDSVLASLRVFSFTESIEVYS